MLISQFWQLYYGFTDINIMRCWVRKTGEYYTIIADFLQTENMPYAKLWKYIMCLFFWCVSQVLNVLKIFHYDGRLIYFSS